MDVIPEVQHEGAHDSPSFEIHVAGEDAGRRTLISRHVGGLYSRRSQG